jgi:hypothetical protein
MNSANVRLSPKELQLVNNAGILLTKNLILQKTYQLLTALQEKQSQYLKRHSASLPAGAFRFTPKISKGENYKGLPWLVLDNPRVFDKKNILAIRSLFWWGHFFSTTLHLSGSYKETFEKKIFSSFRLLQKKGFSVCIHTQEWEHHFEADNYSGLTDMTQDEFQGILRNKPFVKLAKKISLREWDKAPRLLFADFKILTRILLN